MKKRLKNKWVRALRSGQYKQAVNTLYDPYSKGFCCLGVLEHIVLKGNVEQEVCHFDQTMDFRCEPSAAFWASIGVDKKKSSEMISNLICLNDDTRAPFSDIATYIEDNVKGV
jgi:hypothetical protein